MTNALYYPYIRVPQGPWFTRVLLYHDKVGAIVPYEFLEDPDRLGPYMNGLVREGLVTQVIPGAHLWQLPNFADAFLAHVDEHYESTRPARWSRVHLEKLGVSIHMEKLQDLASKLEERGLAAPDRDDAYSPWYRVEEQVAGEFMAYLAAVLGQLEDGGDFAPVTDARGELRRFVPEPRKDSDFRTSIREIILEGILPAPTKAVDPARLRDFKEKYSAELTRFRRLIDATVSDLAANPDDTRRSVRVADVTQELRDDIDELSARMNQQAGWPSLDLSSLCAIAGGGIGGLKAILDHDIAFGLTAAGLGLVSAVVSSFKGSDLDLSDRPIAYAALATRDLP